MYENWTEQRAVFWYIPQCHSMHYVGVMVESFEKMIRQPNEIFFTLMPLTLKFDAA